MHIAALIFLTFSLLGCVNSNRLSATNEATTVWKIGDFGVRFRPGPRGEEGRSYSLYQICHKAAGQQEREVVMESAHTLGGFGSVTNGGLKNWIRIVQDPSGRALLIEEEIPNDCGPCSNYLWVHLDTNGFVEGTYLRLPSKDEVVRTYSLHLAKAILKPGSDYDRLVSKLYELCYTNDYPDYLMDWYLLDDGLSDIRVGQYPTCFEQLYKADAREVTIGIARTFINKNSEQDETQQPPLAALSSTSPVT